MTRIAPDWLSAPHVLAALGALSPASPRFVGGCVRDALMGRPGGDIDICVTVPPEEAMTLAEAAGLRALPTGLEHGVITLLAGGPPIECATLRRDVATDGRRAVVAFTDRFEEDAARRDFTMNALYADAEGRVLDPLGGGLGDLAARRIRFIGAPEARIEEDYLRILRFFRFHAQFGIDAFDPVGLTACHAGAPGLSRVSRERIGAEMKKLLASPDPEPALTAMGPVLEEALPGARPRPGLTAAERTLGLAPDPLRRLAALGGDDPAAALRLSRAEAQALAAARAATGAPPHEAAWRHGQAAAETALALAAANGETPPHGWREDIALAEAATLPLKASALIAAGLTPGPEVGAALRRAEAAWIASKFTMSKDELKRRALKPTADAWKSDQNEAP